MEVTGTGDRNPNANLSVPSEDEGFTLFTKMTVPRKEQPQRSSNRSWNQNKSRMNAPRRPDSNRQHTSTLSAGFGRSKWAKPSSESSSVTLRNRTDSVPMEQTGSVSSSQENSMSMSPSCITNTDNSEIETTKTKSDNFMSQCQTQSLSALMEEYGTYDPDWMKEPALEQSVALTDSAKDDDIQKITQVRVNSQRNEIGVNRLQTHGQAPIHVEFVSFGYRHGVPSEIRHHSTGNSHRQPLPPMDTRSVLERIPPHLEWMDGKSGVIKTTMLRWQPTSSVSQSKSEQMNVRDFAEDVLEPKVADALVDAMVAGGHGYASPLTMTIFVGSELGRHRSVVATELGATALRKRLRRNPGHRFHCAVSVGCRHRDITPQHHSSRNSAATKKQKDFEED
jgi:hypothetical protein